MEVAIAGAGFGIEVWTDTAKLANMVHAIARFGDI